VRQLDSQISKIETFRPAKHNFKKSPQRIVETRVEQKPEKSTPFGGTGFGLIQEVIQQKLEDYLVSPPSHGNQREKIYKNP
jgi:hypothetical protein